MNSIVDLNGYFLPRYYQVIQDRIESKQTMEPIMITHGGGPIIGFDFVDNTKPYLSITGKNNPNIQISNQYNASTAISHRKNTKVSINNISGDLVNAHYTPSGLLSIDPHTLDFPEVPIDWENVDDNPFVIVLKASFTFDNNNPPSTVPSISNFTIRKIERTATDDGIRSLMRMNYKQILQYNNINPNTEVLIGIYQIGYTDHDKDISQSQYFYFYEYFNRLSRYHTIPLVVYENKWPIAAEISLEDKVNIFSELSQYATLPEQIDDINSSIIQIENEIIKPIESNRIQDGAINPVHLSQDTLNLFNDYDYVIRTTEELLALNNKNNVFSVLIKKGLYNGISQSIKIHDNVRTIVQEPGAIINFVGGQGFYRDTINYYTRYVGLGVSVTYGTNNDIDIFGFKNMCNMYNCQVTINRIQSPIVSGGNLELGSCYDSCFNLNGCLARLNISANVVDAGGTQISKDNLHAIAYKNCTDMNACRDITPNDGVYINGSNHYSEGIGCKQIIGGTYFVLNGCILVTRTISKTTMGIDSYASFNTSSAFKLADGPNGGFNQVTLI